MGPGTSAPPPPSQPPAPQAELAGRGAPPSLARALPPATSPGLGGGPRGRDGGGHVGPQQQVVAASGPGRISAGRQGGQANSGAAWLVTLPALQGAFRSRLVRGTGGF